MPNCFQLLDKASKKPADLVGVDNAMRKYFGAPEDTEHWYLGWYDTVGFALAMGNDWNRCRELFLVEGKGRLAPVIDWLEENFDFYAWYERGR